MYNANFLLLQHRALICITKQTAQNRPLCFVVQISALVLVPNMFLCTLLVGMNVATVLIYVIIIIIYVNVASTWLLSVLEK